MLKSFLDLHPTVFHDLHESVDLLHVSTGTGPYNPIVAPIQVTEWWWLAQNEVMELTKRGVPGVWTYDYYDGWVPNYMFWIGVTHNSIGRFYETQSYPSLGRGAAGPPERPQEGELPGRPKGGRAVARQLWRELRRIRAAGRPVRSVRFPRRTSANGTGRIPIQGASNGAAAPTSTCRRVRSCSR